MNFLKKLAVALSPKTQIELDDAADIYTWEAFARHCKSGAITDDDGQAFRAQGRNRYGAEVLPSDIASGNVSKGKYTHILWFNK